MENNLKELLVFLTPLLFIANLVQSLFYLPAAAKVEGKGSIPRVFYYALLFVFFAAMMFSILTPSLLLMWVAIELTTLVSAPLIAYHSTKDSLEAMWKYLLICSIGIAFALFGTMLVLHAETSGSVRWYMAGFAFVLAGYGTKTGLAPFHTWLPDAHSQAPSLEAALSSGALLNCALLGILRGHQIMIAGGLGEFSGNLLMFFGLLSMFTAAVFIVGQGDYKRLLAYSSVEHVGILALSIGIGGTALFGGEGFIMQRISGDGMVFLEIDGHCKEYSLAAGESIVVDTGYLAAMSDTCSMDIVPVQGGRNVLFGGEGLFHTVITGPGNVWLQSMPISQVAQSLAPFLPSSGEGINIKLGDD